MRTENEPMDEFMNQLRAVVSRDENAGRDSCEREQEAIAWAMEEPDPDRGREIRAHVITCRHCLELVMDIRAAREEAALVAGRTPRLHSSLLQAIRRAGTTTVKPPRRGWTAAFKAAVSRMMDVRMPDFRMLSGAAAAACLLFIVYQWPISSQEPSFRFSVMVNAGGAMTRGSGEPPLEYEPKAGDAIPTGRYFRVRLDGTASGHAYLIYVKASGEACLLFSGQTGKTETWIPPDDPYGFRLDTRRGHEVLYTMVSQRPLEGIEQQLGRLQDINLKTLKRAFPSAAIRGFDFIHE